MSAAQSQRYKYVVLGAASGIRVEQREALIKTLLGIKGSDFLAVISYPVSRSNYALTSAYKSCQGIIVDVKSRVDSDFSGAAVDEFAEQADFCDAKLNELDTYHPVWPMGPISSNNIALLFTDTKDPFYSKLTSNGSNGCQWFTAPVPGFGEALKFTLPADLPGGDPSTDGASVSSAIANAFAEMEGTQSSYDDDAQTLKLYSKDEVLQVLRNLHFSKGICFHFRFSQDAYDFYFNADLSALGNFAVHLSCWKVNGEDSVDVWVAKACEDQEYDMERNICGCPGKIHYGNDVNVPTMSVESY